MLGTREGSWGLWGGGGGGREEVGGGGGGGYLYLSLLSPKAFQHSPNHDRPVTTPREQQVLRWLGYPLSAK